MALGKLGHMVTTIAARGSARPPKGKLIETVDARMKFEDEEASYQMCKNVLKGFDIVIDDSHQKFSYLAKDATPDKIKVLGVLHTHPTYQTPPNRGKTWPANYVAVSKKHAMNYSGRLGITIRDAYNGINMERYVFQKEKGARFLWVGRFEAFKGAHIAIHLARTLGLQLDLVGKNSDSPVEYVQQCANMTAGQDNIRYLGEVADDVLVKLYGSARAVLCPYMWEEPLGLVQLEAQACGTPVISTTMGAIPETILHGKTGFLCNSVDEMAAAVKNLDAIDAADCREFVQAKFSREVMARRYEELCREIVDGKEW